MSTTDDDPRAPDLQQLVAKQGGYDKITPEAWAEWDAQNAYFETERALWLVEKRDAQPGTSAEPPTTKEAQLTFEEHMAEVQRDIANGAAHRRVEAEMIRNLRLRGVNVRACERDNAEPEMRQ